MEEGEAEMNGDGVDFRASVGHVFVVEMGHMGWMEDCLDVYAARFAGRQAGRKATNERHCRLRLQMQENDAHFSFRLLPCSGDNGMGLDLVAT